MHNKHKEFKAQSKFQGNRILEMNEDTYKHRRTVMNCLYKINKLLQANALPKLPRQEVRILSETNVCGGMASMGRNIFTIPLCTIKRGEEYTYRIVLHEVLHSAFGITHPNNGCKLMDANTQTITFASIETLENIFLNYVR